MLRIVVVGSVNLDVVASAPRLPVAGETVTGATLARYPGGKGANQALAACRLGAEVALLARVGRDADAQEALSLLREGGVDLAGCVEDPDTHTGIALIVVAPDGENQIVVAPGANHAFGPESLALPEADALICQLETPIDTIAAAAASFDGFFCVNVAPARQVPAAILERADLIVMNEGEAAYMGAALDGCRGFLATTYGASGAVLARNGEELARARPPAVDAVDTTGSGDTFTAALTVELVRGSSAQESLDFACAAGAVAATRHGAQPSFPDRGEVEALRAQT